MSVRDRTTQTAGRRWLGRSLVLAGTAVAGTSAALLVGQPAQADSGTPTDALAGPPVLSEAAALTGEAADIPATALEHVRQADPASFPLDELDPLDLAPDEPVGQLLPSGGGDATAAPDQAPRDTAPATSPIEPADGPDRQADGPATASPQVDASVRVAGRPVPATPNTPEPERPAVNTALPASTGCATTADGQQPGVGHPGRYSTAPLSAGGARPDVCGQDRAEALRGVPSPRPGATPD
ncbi:hypothetical protein E1161_25625 [Saccharopolyspora aridisoli]|uniref:Uncharacterized protein n=1 Tax=Saccharopolyspora aridisoli TaxID=2530385 RepID=A0A4R4UL63_9PSEU|nr:hypothetical protein [Saccharopolyspora aridisoli]TDC87549.1 hypothetical protein E1161_25625 [Saccharopolyspora aridisoli]